MSDTEDSKFRIVASASLRIVLRTTTSIVIDNSFKYGAFIRRFQDEDIDNSHCPSYYFTLSDVDHTSVVLTSQMTLEPSLQVVRQQHAHYMDRCRRQKRTREADRVAKTNTSIQDSSPKIITLHEYQPQSQHTSTSSAINTTTTTSLPSCGTTTTTTHSPIISIEFESEASYFLWHRLFRFALTNLTLSDCLRISNSCDSQCRYHSVLSHTIYSTHTL